LFEARVMITARRRSTSRGVGQPIAAGLRGRVRVARVEQARLGERPGLESTRTPRRWRSGRNRSSPTRRASSEQHEHALDVRVDEVGGAEERPRSTCVSAAKLTASVHPTIASRTASGSQMSPRREAIAGVRLDVPEVLEPAGVGQLVEVDDPPVRALRQHQAHEARTDEPTAAGNQDSHAHLAF